jgi:hypothetical protein
MLAVESSMGSCSTGTMGSPHQQDFTIDFPGATATLAFGINPQGDIVGWYIDSAGGNHGFLLHKGAFIPIDFPGATTTRVFGINGRSDVVGGYEDSGGLSHGFLLHRGDFTTIDAPGSTATTVTGINPEGDIVGNYNAAGVTHGFLARRQDSSEH